ncbi:MAG: O-succinylbenzoic acid--CoA ligase [Bacteroidia bacterium]|jgi:O-succinylbenzoic acid--CoA ligase
MIRFSGKIETINIPNHLPVTLQRTIEEWRDKSTITLETSGSTGDPKSISLSKELVELNASNSKKALGLSNNEKVLVCIPTNKIGGLMLVMRSILFKWNVVIQDPIANPLQIHSTFHDFTFVSLVPYQMAKILSDPISTEKLKKFKTILIGGAAISTVLEQDIATFLSGNEVNVFHSYGMTETASHVALRNMRTMPPNSFTLLDGVKVKRTKSGCMILLFKQLEYKVKTKDVGTVDGRTIHFIARKDEVVNSGGLKLQIHDIRLAIDKIFDDNNLLVRFILWKQPDDMLGEKLVFVGLNSQKDLEVERVLNDTLPKFEIPRIFYWTDAFERKESGKIDRQKTVDRLVEVGS